MRIEILIRLFVARPEPYRQSVEKVPARFVADLAHSNPVESIGVRAWRKLAVTDEVGMQ